MSVAAPSPSFAGNVYDKYGSGNPVVRRLMGGFFSALDDLWAQVAPTDLLDVGCGEGIVTERLAARLPPQARGTGLDRDAPRLRAQWAAHPRVEFVTGDATELPFADGAFDVVTLIEMLQLVPDASRALAEATRVARRAVIASVPREPLWRMLNVARGAYVRSLGDTPGHVHHWSRPAFVELLCAHGRIAGVRSPLPWTIALVRVD